MIITNVTGLPSNIVRAIEKNIHTGGDYSASMLDSPVQLVTLSKRYADKLTQDASEMIYSVIGSSLHTVMQIGEASHQLVEEKLSMTVMGKTVTGIADMYEEDENGHGIITDWKTVSAWTLIFKSHEEAWQKQLSVYKLLFENIGFKPTQLKIIAFVRDHQKSQAKFKPEYPQAQVQVIDIKPLSSEETLKYITDRVTLFEANKDVADGNLPNCTDAETWTRPSIFKCYKKGVIKSKKNFEVEDRAKIEEVRLEASKFCTDNGYELKEVKGEKIRCEDYCLCKNFCVQYAKYKKESTSGQE